MISLRKPRCNGRELGGLDVLMSAASPVMLHFVLYLFGPRNASFLSPLLTSLCLIYMLLIPARASCSEPAAGSIRSPWVGLLRFCSLSLSFKLSLFFLNQRTSANIYKDAQCSGNNGISLWRERRLPGCQHPRRAPKSTSRQTTPRISSSRPQRLLGSNHGHRLLLHPFCIPGKQSLLYL